MKVKILEEVGHVAGKFLVKGVEMEVDERTGKKMVGAGVAEEVKALKVAKGEEK
ncbi:MAG: hypothetical protein KKC80_08870 [Candidatus Margulisbacteria bacterium]|nr:hypothetical protein [Candidatus Margulisiibacteriota bacterium]